MKHLKACTILAALVLSAAGCSDDSSSSGIASLCGNNELNENEICDGTHFKDNAKVCPEGLILKDATAFECTQTCGLDFSKACAKPTCGDGEITAGEVCDQDKFREGVKVCPTGMEEVETPTWGCTQTCLLDITNACKVPDSSSGTCEPEEEPVCGDGKLTGREVCDGKLFVENVKACPPGQKKVPGRELF